MCLYNERKNPNLPKTFIGYCMVRVLGDGNFGPADLAPHLQTKLKESNYKMGKEYRAEVDTLHYGGFHGTKTIKSLSKVYSSFFDAAWVKGTFSENWMGSMWEGEYPKFVMCKCEFRIPIAEGEASLGIMAFRAKYRTILEVVLNEKGERVSKNEEGE